MTEPNTALAGEIQEISFARSRASMATFSEERAPSRPFGRWSFASMVKTRDSLEKRSGTRGVGKGQNPNRDKRPFRHNVPHADRSLWWIIFAVEAAF